MSKRPGDPGYADGWCIYFRSAGQFKTCEKGIPYDRFRPGISSTPCFCREPAHEPLKEYCEHRRLPTAKEIELHKEWVASRVNNLGLVFEAISPWITECRKKRISATKWFDCPACKAKTSLYVSIVASNGHTQGRCKTERCVEWIQ